MASAVLQHLDGAKLLLGILPKGEKRDQVEQLQSDRVIKLLRLAKLSTMQAATVAEAVRGAGFDETHVSSLLDVLMACITDDGDEQKFQNYESLVQFLPARLWEHMNPSALFEFLAKRLGLIKPSEGTFQTIAITLLIGSEGAEAACEYTSAQKNEYMKSVKRKWSSFKGHELGNQQPQMWLLPQSPTLLTPSLLQKIYGDEAPAPSRIDDFMLERMRGGNWMRWHPSKKNKEAALALQRGPSLPSSDGTVQMMSCMAGLLTNILPQLCGLGRDASPPLLPGLTLNAKPSTTGTRRSILCDLETPSRPIENLASTDVSVSSPRETLQVVCADVPTEAQAASMPAKTDQDASKRHQESVDSAAARILGAMQAKDVSNKKRARETARTEVSTPAKETSKKTSKKGTPAKVPVRTSHHPGCPKIQHEKSRCNFLVRGLTGASGTRQFAYGKGRTYKNEAAAKKAAEACAKKGS